MKVSRKQRKKKTGPKKEKEFLDVAHEAFIRYLALDLWRRVEGVRQAGAASEEAQPILAAATAFDARFPYQEPWQRTWRNHVGDRLWTAQSDELLGLIEGMVTAALDAEEAARRDRGDQSLHDEDDYIAFIDDQLAYLFQHREDEFSAE
jgi:hypothetical protein